MPNITGHTELVGLIAYPIRHTQSPTTHNLAYDKNGDDVIQLAFEVDNDSLKDAVQSIRALKMLGSNISMPNKTVVHKYLDEVDEAAKLCGAINTVVNLRDENGQVTYPLKEKGYNMNDVLGISGLESVYEDELRGKDGVETITRNSDGVIVDTRLTTVPEPGHTVQLTINSDFQRAVNKALANNIDMINRTYNTGNMKAAAGAAV